MKPKRAAKELEKQLRKDPDNLVLRLRLAAALRETGKTARAVELYRSVATAYHQSGRFSQAMAVCKSVLEIDPSQRETQALLAEIETRVRTRAAQEAQAQAAAAAQRGPTGDAATRVRRASGVPPLRRKRPTGAPPSSEFPSRSGMTPLSGDLPSLPRGGDSPSGRQPAKRRSSDQLIASGSRPPGVRSSRRVKVFRDSESPEPPPAPEDESGSTRPSFGMTPLPAPLAPHDADSDPMMSDPRIGDAGLPPRRTPPPLPTPTPTPVPARSASGRQPRAPAPRGARPQNARQVDDEAPTTIAAELGWRPPGTPPLPNAAPQLADDPARDTPPPVPRPSAPRPSAPRPLFDEATRLGDSLAAIKDVREAMPTDGNGVAALRDSVDDVAFEGPTNPGFQSSKGPAADPDSMTTNPRIDPKALAEHAARLREERVTQPEVPTKRTTRPIRAPGTAAAPGRESRNDADGDDDEATRVQDPDAFATSEYVDVDLDPATERVPRYEPQAVAAPSTLDDGPSNDGIRLPSAFDESFEPVLEELAPDGAVIDVPRNLFAELPEDAVAELVRRMVLRRFDAEDLIIREGEPGEACYVIASGAVRVLKRDPSAETGDFIEVARLGAGAVVGEFALLADRRRHATVQALEESELYEIPRRVLRDLAANYPGVGPALERFYRQRLLSTLIATAPFLAPLPEEERTELLARFVPKHCGSGQEIVREGTPAGGLYLIVMGSVEITKRVPRQRAVVLATLGEGTYFGELSLMRGSAAQATVTATGPTELAVLPPKDFYDIVASNPVLWDAMRREARRRELAIAEIVAGESGSV